MTLVAGYVARKTLRGRPDRAGIESFQQHCVRHQTGNAAIAIEKRMDPDQTMVFRSQVLRRGLVFRRRTRRATLDRRSGSPSCDNQRPCGAAADQSGASCRVCRLLAQPAQCGTGCAKPESLARLTESLRLTGTAGILTSDAHVAALALEHGCDIYSADHDFARFPGVRHVNPLR